ncbi:hypothetical protein HYH03_004516 [Edaphochlamys debaryana]|uniref:ABC transporter domain-containing protein n=1 Tax=Edaphochlamys debaryana TaxID=47281 RepID=A0A835Y6R9_9CHLO|nr:hypothetical protein HYH03_004516 [Edaphochlamys debaryana]|eukprot:KAG2497357.1 hypothetical protein HYH03_004516 [Edaphochlamys debaryana]
MDRRLYCGFGAARCDGTFFTREYGAAWDFERLEPTALHVTNVYNLSLPYEEGPNNYRHNELLNAATRGWTQAYWGTLPITARLRNRLLGLMSFPKLPTELKLDFSVLLGPLFYTWVVQMLMPSLLQQLVYEKEKRLRSMMKMHGLSDVAYWTVTYLWYLMLYVLYMVFFVVFGSAIGLKIFRTNSYGVQAVLYFIFGNNMIAFMYVLSSLFRSSRTATVSMFLYVFATGLMGELLLRDLMHTNPPFMVAVELLPGFALFRGLYELSEYSIRSLLGNTPGMTWASLSDPGNGMVTAWVIMLVEWPIFVLLGWYLEQVVSSGTGMRRHPLFFIRWMWHEPDDELAALHAYGHTGIKAAAADAAAPKPADSSSPTAASTAAADPPPVPQIANAPADSAYVPQHVSAVDSAYTPGFQVPDPVANGKRAVAEGTETTAVPTAAEELSDLAGGSTAAPGSGRLMVVAEAASPPRSRTASGGGGGGGGSARLHVGDAVSVGSGPASAASNHTVVLVGPSAGPGGGGSGSDGGSRPASSAAASPVPAVASGAASSAVTSGASRPSSGAAASSSQEADARIIVCPPDSARLGSGSGSGNLGKGSSFVTGAKAALAGLVRTSPKAAISPEEAAGSYTPDGVAVAGLQETGAEGVGGGGVKGMPDEIPWDVAAECVRVDEMDDERLRSTPIVIKGLTKVFPTDRGRSKRLAGTGGGGGGGGSRLGVMFSCCGARGGGGPRGHAAVRGLTLAIEKGECFGLLGPNGAGKTTTIHMLTGFLESSAGDALVGGASVRSRMPHIYKTMGVCPQENLLWEQLTGEEHLLFYGRLKGLKGQELKDAVAAALRAVGLESRTTASASTTSTTTATASGGGTATANGTGTGTAAATPARGGTAGTLASSSGAGRRRVGAYSGGMKRRLSVAIAFMGDPSVVYLDEPSTGLDPASRRALWDVVRAHKPGRALVLTTHSMEEAETLCDRLGIFVDGRLVCLGAPREITARHAGYLVFTLTVAPSPGGQAEAEAAEFVAALCPGARRTYHLGGTSKYELPTSGVSLSGVFDAMSAAKEAGRMQVLDWGVASATLEEVFIKFARQIGAEVGDF